MNIKLKVTIDDVAKAAGVSKQTVSRAINDKGEISPKTRDRILALVKEMGYRPNRMAQAMNTSRSHMIGLVVPDITNPFFPEVVRAVQDTARVNGYTTIICNTDEDPEIELLNDLVSHGVDGLITFTHRAHEQSVRDFADRFSPMLIINRELAHPNVTSLMVDNFQGGCLAVKHLADLGHRKIGMLTTELDSTSNTRRVQGYRHGLANEGLLEDPELLVQEDPTLAGGYSAANMLLEHRPDVTAIFAYNDLMAVGAMRACKELGLSIPNDISVIGFDDIQIASMVTPALSSVHVNKYEIGRLAFERIYSLIQGDLKNVETINIMPTIMIRESTGPIAEQSAQEN